MGKDWMRESICLFVFLKTTTKTDPNLNVVEGAKLFDFRVADVLSIGSQKIERNNGANFSAFGAVDPTDGLSIFVKDRFQALFHMLPEPGSVAFDLFHGELEVVDAAYFANFL